MLENQNVNKFKKIETISSIFSDNNVIKHKINYKKKMENLQICAHQYITKPLMGQRRNQERHLKNNKTNRNTPY